jgi:hypothetical protein
MAILLEELGKVRVARQVDPVREQLAAEAQLLLVSAVGQFEEDRVEVVFVDAGGSQTASKSPGSSFAVTKLPFSQTFVHPAPASSLSASASPSSWA